MVLKFKKPWPRRLFLKFNLWYTLAIVVVNSILIFMCSLVNEKVVTDNQKKIYIFTEETSFVILFLILIFFSDTFNSYLVPFRKINMTTHLTRYLSKCVLLENFLRPLFASMYLISFNKIKSYYITRYVDQ